MVKSLTGLVIILSSQEGVVSEKQHGEGGIGKPNCALPASLVMCVVAKLCPLSTLVYPMYLFLFFVAKRYCRV